MSERSAKTIPVFDGHNDTLLHMANLGKEDGDWSFFRRNETGHIDLVRAKEGGLAGGFFAIFAPHARGEGDKLGRSALERTHEGYQVPMAPAIPLEKARDYTLEVMELLEELESRGRKRLFVARDFEELSRGIDDGKLAVVLHFEGAAAIDEDLKYLEEYYQRGLRSVGIVWSRPNIFGHGVPFRFPSSPDTGPGLSEAGKRLVRACNEMGILVDLAHLNEAGFWDVASLSDRPLVVSHACCHAICPSARNLTDRQLDAIGESGGLVGINFFVGDVRADGHFICETPLVELVRHIDYVASRIGIDHVAFGSDFDGARVPDDLGDASGLPRLVDALRDHGYDEEAIGKVAFDNWMRVIEQTW